MLLPREIRNHIYKDVFSAWSGDSFDGVMLSLSPPGVIRHSTKQTECKKHPTREYNYDLSPRRASETEAEDILNLSNTNSIVRQELAEVFWARVSIDLRESPMKYFDQLLFDRPAVWNGIKELSFSLEFDGDERLPDKSFVKSCQRAAAMVDLDTLIFEITIHEIRMDGYLKKSTKPSWIEAMRGLKVSKEFRLDLKPVPDFDPYADEEEWEENMDKVVEEYQPKMEDLLRPYSLLAKAKPLSDMDEVETYMATRLL